MSDDPIDRTGLRRRFWETEPLEKLTTQEWEALCDGCGKCCLNKLEDEETGEVVLTRVACRLLDDQSCHCAQYPIRHQFVPECIVLNPKTIMPTCIGCRKPALTAYAITGDPCSRGIR